MDKYIIAINIGNSNTSAALIDTDTLDCIMKYTIPSSDNSERIVDMVEKIIFSTDYIDNLVIKVCCVSQLDTYKLSFLLSSISRVKEVIFVKYHDQLPFEIKYENVNSLGKDRIAACLYAVEKFSGENCIIIDAGTAVTLNLLTAERQFIGGFILPGIAMQLQSLHEKTAQLPNTDFCREYISLHPQSTQAAMISGVAYSVAGAMSFIVENCRKKLFHNCRVLATGGGLEYIKDIIPFNYIYIKDLTLTGIALYR